MTETVHQPTTFEEALAALDTMIDEGDLRAALMRSEGSDDLAISVHHTFGMRLRNEWGLWSNSALAQDLKRRFGVDHPDDMSHKVLVAYIESKAPDFWERLLKKD